MGAALLAAPLAAAYCGDGLGRVADLHLDPNAAPDWIARYVHDAFGRLMRKRAPHPGDADKKVTDEYYYDGVRRIQTKTTWQAVSGWPSGAAWQEYVYGPDYVDEFVAFVDDPLGAGVGTYYTLQDANYNLMATLRANANDGGPGGGGGGLTAENVVVRQYQWSPYGAPVVAETLTDNLPSAVTEAQAAAAGRIGHQGLFFERYDSGADEPGIAANAAGIYYNRARFYTPYLGRFLQKDMNAAGLPIVAALAFNAAALDAFLDAFDAQNHYGDGLNLYAYVGSNPVGRRDPSGLVYDPFEDVDDVIGAMQAEKVAWSGAAMVAGFAVLEGLGRVALEITLSAILPGYAVSMAAEGIGLGLEDILTNGPTLGNLAQLGLNAAGLRAAGGALGGFGRSLQSGLARYRAVASAPRALRSFTAGNFRHNLIAKSGLDPGDAVQAHHVFPQAHADRFQSVLGINVHDPKYGAWFAKARHQSTWRRINTEWDDFFLKSPTVSGAMELARQQGLTYGFQPMFR